MREELPSSLTLGQIVDTLHKKIELISNPNSNQNRSLEKLSELTKNLRNESEIKDIKQIFSELQKIIEEDRRFFSKNIAEKINTNQKISPFSKKILSNINELLKWRNSAAHNSRVPLGTHEADRTIFCLVRLIDWWNITSNKIDWNKNKNEIILDLIELSKI